MSKPFVLMIMDGFAHNPNPKANAVFHANKPNLDRLFKTYPYTELTTFGERVGLPDDQMGNSEVGHLNIGGGRVVEQELTRINKAVRTGTLIDNATIKKTFDSVADGGTLHLIGLASSGGVHSHMDHLKALITAAAKAKLPSVAVHAISDGRDRPPTAALEEIGSLESFIAGNGAGKIKLATICGRYFAMDRDKRWERVEKAYRLYTEGLGDKFTTAVEGIKSRHNAGQTDEFLEPIVLNDARIKDGDVVLLFNFRTDRMRQLVAALLGEKVNFTGFNRKVAPKLRSISTMTEYEEGLPVEVIYPPYQVKNHLGAVLANSGLKQLRIAETEKYPHVTYFFNGGVEETLPGEERVLIPSPRDVATYDLKPEMSAFGVTEALIEKLEGGAIDVAIVNFANCDMVGHTGVFEAAKRAVETVDQCVGRVWQTLEKLGGTALITADHGNADQMVDYETGEPHTFHTKHPVPCVLCGTNYTSLRPGGALCDIAPTIIRVLGLKQPMEMTGESLVG